MDLEYNTTMKNMTKHKAARFLVMLAFLPLLLAAQEIPVQESLLKPVYIVPIEGPIDKGLALFIDRAVTDAEREGASFIIFHLDTFGGLVDAADEITPSRVTSNSLCCESKRCFWIVYPAQVPSSKSN